MCIPSTTIAGAGQHQFNDILVSESCYRVPFLLLRLRVLRHSLISQCTPLYDVPRTHDVGLPTQYPFNVGPASQPIAGSMLVNRLRRLPNTNPTPGLLYTLRHHISKHMAFTQCCFNIYPDFALAQHWNRIGWFSRVCYDCYVGDALDPRHQKGHFPDNTIHWLNADAMLRHRLRRWINIIPTKTLRALITNIIWIYFFWALYKTTSRPTTKPQTLYLTCS